MAEDPELPPTSIGVIVDFENDNCQLCYGQSGGVPGNENRLPNGLVVCDYCWSKISAEPVAMQFDERLQYEERILAVEMRAERLKRLITVPNTLGSYVGDTWYPVGGTEASHRWDGNSWQWLPELLCESCEGD